MKNRITAKWSTPPSLTFSKIASKAACLWGHFVASTSSMSMPSRSPAITSFASSLDIEPPSPYLSSDLSLAERGSLSPAARSSSLCFETALRPPPFLRDFGPFFPFPFFFFFFLFRRCLHFFLRWLWGLSSSFSEVGDGAGSGSSSAAPTGAFPSYDFNTGAIFL
eukprot:UN00379